MLIQQNRSQVQTLAVSGLLLSALLASPVCMAGGAMLIVPTEESDVPLGSQIPQRRIDAIERQVSEFNAQTEASTEKRDTPSTSN